MPSPFYFPLMPPQNETARIFWKNTYYTVSAVMVFPEQLKGSAAIQEALQSQRIVVKLTPFQSEFRAKMLAAVAKESTSEKTEVIAATLVLNVLSGKVQEIEDIRKTNIALKSGEARPFSDSQEQQILSLSEQENRELANLLEKAFSSSLAKCLREPFQSFVAGLAEKEWRERIPKKDGKSLLVPYQGLFPASGSITREYQGKEYFIDDLYCVNPNCDCQEVTCVILTMDERAQQETVFGGFKYHLQKKSFKVMPDFPANFNPQQWFKEFAANTPFDLSDTLESRYSFLRQKV